MSRRLEDWSSSPPEETRHPLRPTTRRILVVGASLVTIIVAVAELAFASFIWGGSTDCLPARQTLNYPRPAIRGEFHDDRYCWDAGHQRLLWAAAVVAAATLVAAAGVARPTDPIFYAAIWMQAMLILGVGVAWLQST